MYKKTINPHRLFLLASKLFGMHPNTLRYGKTYEHRALRMLLCYTLCERCGWPRIMVADAIRMHRSTVHDYVRIWQEMTAAGQHITMYRDAILCTDVEEALAYELERKGYICKTLAQG